MGIDEELQEMRDGSRRSGSCNVCLMVETMTPEHLEAFNEGLKDKRVTYPGVLRWLDSKGYVIDLKDKQQALARHSASHVD